jgi:ribose-phosphate pyrophosphokinase
MKILTITSKKLAPAVARELKVELIKPFYKQFPDKEPYIRFDRKFDGEEIVLIQSTYPNQDKRLHEIYFTVDRLKELGARKVKAVIPYLAYLRQDRDFSQELGIGYEIISAKFVIKVLKNCGIDELYTVDAHSKRILKQSSIFTSDLDPSSLFSRYIQEKIGKPLLVAPDENAANKVEKIARELDCNYTLLEKERNRISDEVRVKPISESLDAENAVIIDDIISTGRTIAETSKILRGANIKNIFAICTHALMTRNAEEKLRKEGIKEIISTDSIESKFSKISLSRLISSLFQ